MKRIVLFVEGEGEADAVPRLVSRIITDLNGWDAVIVDPNPFRVGDVSKVAKNDFSEWKKELRASLLRKNVGGILLLLDGDASTLHGRTFCAKEWATKLASEACDVGGGTLFSAACVFACLEFESWFIAAAAGYGSLPDNRKLTLPERLPDNPEKAPRDAKRWLRKVVAGGYKPTRDQAIFAQAMDLTLLRNSKMRSFIRMENAIGELINGCRTGDHIVSPIESQEDLVS